MTSAPSSSSVDQARLPACALGISAAKGLAEAAAIPLIAISSLAALSGQVQKRNSYCTKSGQGGILRPRRGARWWSRSGVAGNGRKRG